MGGSGWAVAGTGPPHLEESRDGEEDPGAAPRAARPAYFDPIANKCMIAVPGNWLGSVTLWTCVDPLSAIGT